MTARTVPFHYGLFWHAMIALIGREPDVAYQAGSDGIYSFIYKPQDEGEKRKFAKDAVTLREWLELFELTPLASYCTYGSPRDPSKREEDVDWLDIHIVHPFKIPPKRR